MNMKKIFLLIPLFFCLSLPLNAYPEKYDHFSLGFHLTSNAGDYGIGLETASPLFKGIFGLQCGGRVMYDYMWYEGVTKNSPTETWSPYHTVRAGFVMRKPFTEYTILYFTLGGLTVFTNSDIDKDKNVYGLWDCFGFEFPHSSDGSHAGAYYIEIGSQPMMTDFEAENAGDEEPIYLKGMRIACGFRGYL